MWANTTGAALQQRRFREAEADQPRRNATVVDGALWACDGVFSGAESSAGSGAS